MYAADARHPNKTLEDKLRAIYELRGGPTIDLTIRQPYRDLLKALGNPHEHLPPVVHVAGTNGKGSVVAMIRAVMEAAGYRVHVYTSPHLVRFNERIVLAGRQIDDGLLESLLDEVMAANAGGALTFFEITTALAFLAFARTPADICLLETGLGGRLDCTNVVERPAATAITAIGLDHREFLGDTLAAIAGEKAGIMKPGVPCIVSPQVNAEVYDVFTRHAALLSSPLIRAEVDINLPPTNMTGPHQRRNAATALACLKALQGFALPDNAVRQGLVNVRWPGRLQQIRNKALPSGWELWIDGGHNENAAQALAGQADLWTAQDGLPLHIVMAMKRDKDPRAFVNHLIQKAFSIHFIDGPDTTAFFSARELFFLFPKVKLTNFYENHDVTAVLSRITPCHREGRVLVTGSLYLMGAVLGDYGG